MDSKYLYWITTSLLALFMAASAVLYFVAEGPANSFQRLGFPDYFRIQLGIAKMIGAVALMTPVPRAVKEWTYAGFTISFVSAIIAHTVVGDPLSDIMPPVVAFAILGVSYASYHQYYRGAAHPSSPDG